MTGIEKEIAFSRNQGARHPQYGRGRVGHPFVSNPPYFAWCRFRSPIPGQHSCVNVDDVRVLNPNLKQHILFQQFRGVQVNQNFQNRQ